MARTKAENIEEVIPATPEVVESKPVAKGAKVSISASFKTRTMDGDRIVHKYAGEGATVAEAISNVRGSDEELVDEFDRPFPPRINMLVNVVAKRGEYRFDRALAPHVANDIFIGKNVALAARLLGL